MTKRILLSAYSCEPGKGSEPGVGWHWLMEICKANKVWVITRKNNKKQIEHYVKDTKNIIFLYYDLPHWLSFWKRKGRGVHLYYYLWQLATFIKFRKVLSEQRIDIIHHITFGVYWLPSFFIYSNIPFVLGPVGGAEKPPSAMIEIFSFKGKLYEHVRNFIRFLFEFDPTVRRMIKSSSIILCKSKETKARLAQLGANNLMLFPESGISLKELQTIDEISNGRPKKSDSDPIIITSVGRLLSWKGYEYSFHALAKLTDMNFEFWIFGNGPRRKDFVELVKKLGLESKVKFFGHIDRSVVLEKICDTDLFLHPSLHDSGGWACLEAMAAKKPVICFDIGGPAVQVMPETGIVLEPKKMTDVVINDLHQAILRLANDKNLRHNLGNEARQRINEVFLWSNKEKPINEVYDQL